MKGQNSIPPQKEKCEDSSLKYILRHVENEHIKYIVHDKFHCFMYFNNFIGKLLYTKVKKIYMMK